MCNIMWKLEGSDVKSSRGGRLLARTKETASSTIEILDSQLGLLETGKVCSLLHHAENEWRRVRLSGDAEKRKHRLHIVSERLDSQLLGSLETGEVRLSETLYLSYS